MHLVLLPESRPFTPIRATTRMAPMAQPPSSEQSNATEPATNCSLATSVLKLHDLLSKITFPKTRGAKTATIKDDTLHLAQELAVSAFTALQEHHKLPQLSDISKQLETIKTHCKVHNSIAVYAAMVSLLYSL